MLIQKSNLSFTVVRWKIYFEVGRVNFIGLRKIFKILGYECESVRWGEKFPGASGLGDFVGHLKAWNVRQTTKVGFKFFLAFL